MLYNFLLTFIRFIFRLINGREVVQGLENLPKDQPYIIAATHRSLTDPLFVAFETYPHQIAFMAKESLFKFKPLGWLFRKVNVFPVNRDKPSTSTIKHAVKIMNEDGKIYETAKSHHQSRLGKRFCTTSLCLCGINQFGCMVCSVGHALI